MLLSETDRVNIVLKAIGEGNIDGIERAMAALDFKMEAVAIAGRWSIAFAKGDRSPTALGDDRGQTVIDAACAALALTYPVVPEQRQGE